MKKSRLLFSIKLILFLIICRSCVSQTSDTEEIDMINYTPYYHDKRGSLMAFDAILNDSIKGTFEFDSGLTGFDMIIDSTFFFQNFDVTKFKQKKFPYSKLLFYIGIFHGNFTVQVGNHKFVIEDFLVQNLNIKNPQEQIFNGKLGSKMLEDKILVIDFEKRRVAFLDSITVDSSYAMVKFKPSRNDSVIGRRRYIEIGGFRDKKGKPIQTQFIFDTGNTFSAVATKNEIGIKMSNRLHDQKDSYAIGYMNIKEKQIRGRVDSLTIGPFALKNPTVSYSVFGGSRDPHSNIIGGDGWLGLPFLVRFNLIVDYKSNTLYFKPNSYLSTGASYFCDPTKDSIYIKNSISEKEF